jgi:hypothetical protein
MRTAELRSVTIARVWRDRIPRCSMCGSRLTDPKPVAGTILCAGCRKALPRRVHEPRGWSRASWWQRLSQRVIAIVAGVFWRI